MHRDELELHYRATSYIIELPGDPIVLRIGLPNSALDTLLASRSVTAWAFITAWNPGSLILPPAENERNNNDLLERVRAMGYEPLPAVGVGDSGGWLPERSFFIPGIPCEPAHRLGLFYRQRAIVVGTLGSPPALLWC